MLRALAMLAAAAFTCPAFAQSAPGQPAPPIPSGAPAPAASVEIHLAANLGAGGQPIRSGLIWRVFSEKADQSGMNQVARSTAATPTFKLPPGRYMVHAAYGFASAIKRIDARGPIDETLTINAGALKIKGVIGDTPIPPSKLKFSVYVPIGPNPEGRLVVADAKPNDLIRLPEGAYHVVSTYGDSNAIMRADLRVENGKVTEATLNHRAATVTLKLVSTPGGEAFAGTAFSVLTPGGDVIREAIIREAIGAFPSFVLAEGDYVVIARHEGQVYTREFKVQSGLDRDIEVTAK
jgi:hypothetical protein